MNRFAGVRRPKGREMPKGLKMTKDEMIDWFKSAPEDTRHQRMLWAAREIARLTGVTEVHLDGARRSEGGSATGFVMAIPSRLMMAE
jgi:hypothetical protein